MFMRGRERSNTIIIITRTPVGEEETHDATNNPRGEENEG
jgi:hypothetical protein